MVLYISAVVNDVGHERCQSLVPWKIQAFRGFTPLGLCDIALFGDFVEGEPDWIVNMDEDCFCYAPHRIDPLIQYMQDNDYDLCGVPEGGMVTHRQYDPLAMNMSFTIANVAKFRQWRSEFHPDRWKFRPELTPLAPYHILHRPYQFGNWEPTYPWFYFLLEKGAKCLYLRANMDDDGISCHILDHNTFPLAAHAFMGSAYNRAPEVRERIDKLFDKCRRLRGNHGNL